MDIGPVTQPAGQALSTRTERTLLEMPKDEAGQGANPLAGLRVADFSTVMAGPYCTRLLADMGADVIKIESPKGDTTRENVPLRDGHSSYFGALNVGKRSVVLDLKSRAAQEAAQQLVKTSDVLVENFRPGVMARLGLGYDVVRSTRPGIVYASVSGYGQVGPGSDRPATAQAVHALSGYDLALQRYQPFAAKPGSTGLFVADALAGALMFGAILTALRGREQTGHGCLVDLSMHEAILSMMVYELQAAQFPPGYDRRGYPPARTSDGYVMIAVIGQRTFENMARAIDRPELVEDARFRSTTDRWANMLALYQEIEAWTEGRTAADCEAVMLQAGVPAAQYRTPEEQLSDPQLLFRHSFADAVDEAGPFRVLDAPFMFTNGVDQLPRRSGPLEVRPFGGDTLSILGEVVGVSKAEQLVCSGAAISSGAPASQNSKPQHIDSGCSATTRTKE